MSWSSICIFLENQNFQKQTEAMVLDLHASTASAASQMQDISQSLGYQSQGIDHLGEQITLVDAKQKDLEEGIETGISEVRKLQESSETLLEKMNQSLELEVSVCLLLRTSTIITVPNCNERHCWLLVQAD